MAEELTTKQFVDIETGKPVSNPVYIGDVYDKDGADAVLRLFGQDKTRDTCGRVGDYRITDDPVLAENHLWPDGGPSTRWLGRSCTPTPRASAGRPMRRGIFCCRTCGGSTWWAPTAATRTLQRGRWAETRR